MVGAALGLLVGGKLGADVGLGVSHTPFVHMYELQSPALLQALPSTQPWHEPPQSTSDSSTSLTSLMQ